MATTYLATDEDISIRDGGDYARICPEDQRAAAGTDGAIDAMSWTLTSAAIGDFAAIGVKAGQMCLLQQAGIRALGDLLVVDAVATTDLVLRRKGQASGVGMPPGGPAGLADLIFTVLTLGPQIEDASYAVEHEYGIDDAITGMRLLDLYDPRELRQATVLTVLKRQYLALARTSGQEDTYWVKFRVVDNELAATKDRLVLHRNSVLPGYGTANEISSMFGCRLSR